MNRLVAEVVVDIRTRALDRPFDYAVSDTLASSIHAGHRVLVSFGNKLSQGYVVRVVREEDYDGDFSKLKPVLSVLDDLPIMPEDLLQLSEWLTDRYVCTRLEAIQTIVPGAFRLTFSEKFQRTKESVPDDLAPEFVKVLQMVEGKGATLAQISARLGEDALTHVRRLEALGLIEELSLSRDRIAEKTIAVAYPAAPLQQLIDASKTRQGRAPKQSKILLDVLDFAAKGAIPVPLSELGVVASDGAIKALVKLGLLKIEDQRADREVNVDLRKVDVPVPELTSWQAHALSALQQARRKFDAPQVVLHGVTGSGKTEIYLRAIEQCLDEGKSAIVLVPEISLTPQMVTRFTRRFGPLVSVLHSALSGGERRDGWMRLRRGEARVAVGARSAVFAPIQNLGLIIIDEEHEPSYKQEETPYYDAKEVAVQRALQNEAMVVFGSATPSLEAMARVEQGKAVLAVLPQRVHGGAMPPVEIVDMRDELREGNRSLFSKPLSDGLEACIGAGHQAILFLNRRGYSAFLLCRNCGERLECPNCDISLTLHRSRTGEWLSCHYCQYTAPVPLECPSCGESAMRPFGIGTQQVEEHLRTNWPHWRVLRMDVDTTRRKGAHQDIIGRFEQEEADILLGTQMVAKGLDFANVAFVGVISADTMLSVPDYRANERTFNLLTQVAGRSGRADVPGKTVIQTYRPDHYSILAASRHDYTSFYQREKAAREAFSYPPFCELALFVAVHAEERIAKGAAERFEREAKRRLSQTAKVLSAVPSSVGRVENQFRYQVVVKYSAWSDVKFGIKSAYEVVSSKMRTLNGRCVLDVQAGRM